MYTYLCVCVCVYVMGDDVLGCAAVRSEEGGVRERMSSDNQMNKYSLLLYLHLNIKVQYAICPSGSPWEAIDYYAI